MRNIQIYKPRLNYPVFRVVVAITKTSYDSFTVDAIDYDDAIHTADVMYPKAIGISAKPVELPFPKPILPPFNNIGGKLDVWA